MLDAGRIQPIAPYCINHANQGLKIALPDFVVQAGLKGKQLFGLKPLNY